MPPLPPPDASPESASADAPLLFPFFSWHAFVSLLAINRSKASNVCCHARKWKEIGKFQNMIHALATWRDEWVTAIGSLCWRIERENEQARPSDIPMSSPAWCYSNPTNDFFHSEILTLVHKWIRLPSDECLLSELKLISSTPSMVVINRWKLWRKLFAQTHVLDRTTRRVMCVRAHRWLWTEFDDRQCTMWAFHRRYIWFEWKKKRNWLQRTFAAALLLSPAAPMASRYTRVLNTNSPF